jgi:protein phosphatase
VEYISSGHTVKGSKCDRNEDHFLIKNEVGLHIVCDGFGEDGRGALASQMTTDFIAQVMIASKKVFAEYKTNPNDQLRDEITELVDQAINKISLQILSIIKKDTVRRQMGTTLSMVLVAEDGVFLAHIGNSRIYLIREDNIHLLTEDHVSKKMDKKAKLIDDELTLHGLSTNALTRMLGSEQQLKVDLLFMEVMPSDTLLLCTDGVANLLSDTKIFEIVKESGDDKLAKEFIDYASDINCKDNATAITITFDQSKKKTERVTPQMKFSTLQKIPLFSELDYKEMSKLLTFMKMKKFSSGQNIVEIGTKGEELFVILTGSADVIIQDEIVTGLTTGNYFGELALIDQEPRTATVKATSDLEVLVLKRKDFDFLITHESQLSVKMLWRFAQTLCARIRHTDHEPADIDKTKSNINISAPSKIVLNFD